MVCTNAKSEPNSDGLPHNILFLGNAPTPRSFHPFTMTCRSSAKWDDIGAKGGGLAQKFGIGIWAWWYGQKRGLKICQMLKLQLAYELEGQLRTFCKLQTGGLTPRPSPKYDPVVT